MARYSRSGPMGNHTAFLPTPEVLEAYEKLEPGATKKLLELAKKEQEHRHQWQNKYLTAYNITYRIGQFLGLIYSIMVLYILWALIAMGDYQFAYIFMGAIVALIIFAILATKGEREHWKKRPRPLETMKDKQRKISVPKPHSKVVPARTKT